jgi:hypothetical protein
MIFVFKIQKELINKNESYRMEDNCDDNDSTVT